ncbi:uncharacterized protein YALI1_B09316g [Yarrowia lipolytica]|uniref:Uncharacterized protein n=1 Tax=Yarrowia lipolytica TaxID=4952 RepID=A0A1D8N6T8_YARLL|nr:hypothetical protein YALI1_B09316g [Yarrowia lipolytica]
MDFFSSIVPYPRRSLTSTPLERIYRSRSRLWFTGEYLFMYISLVGDGFRTFITPAVHLSVHINVGETSKTSQYRIHTTS